MSTSDRDTFKLYLPTDGQADISVMDARDNIVYSGGGEVEGTGVLNLKAGVYRVRFDANNKIEEKVLRLAADVDLRSYAPTIVSAAPIEGSSLATEYYAKAAREWSTRLTTKNPLPGTGTSQPAAEFFLFLRTADLEAAKVHGDRLAKDLFLCDASGRNIVEFSTANSTFERKDGWMAFSALAEPGLYRLVYLARGEGREVGISLVPHFQTQVFVVQGEKPLLEGMRVFMERTGAGFQPAGWLPKIADRAMEAFLNRDIRLSKLNEQMLLNGKFDNPIYGLIGAYTLIRRLGDSPSASARSEGDLRLLDKVIENLSSLLPFSMDLLALRVLRAELTYQPMGSRPKVSEPPMFRIGLDALIRAENSESVRFDDDGLIQAVCANRLWDSPWTSWRPLRMLGLAAQRIRFVDHEKRMQFKSRSFTHSEDFEGTVDTAATDGTMTSFESFEPDWIQTAFLEAIDSQLSRQRRKLESADGLPSISRSQFVESIRTTRRLLDRRVRELDELNPLDRSHLLESEWPKIEELFERDGLSFSQLLK